jgi:hypothetical protein
MTNTLFLDIDGVLNSTRSFYAFKTKVVPTDKKHNEYGRIDPVTISMLQELHKECPFDIVISSSWRIIYPLSYIIEMFEHIGWVNPPIIDITPDKTRFRGDEVQQWLDVHPEVTQYVILDDDSDFHPHQPYVKVNGRIGLTYVNILMIKLLFNKITKEEFHHFINWYLPDNLNDQLLIEGLSDDVRYQINNRIRYSI